MPAINRGGVFFFGFFLILSTPQFLANTLKACHFSSNNIMLCIENHKIKRADCSDSFNPDDTWRPKQKETGTAWSFPCSAGREKAVLDLISKTRYSWWLYAKALQLMENINAPMNLHSSGVFEKAFAPILLKTHQLHKSGLLVFGVKNCAFSAVVNGEGIKYQDSRSHLCIKQTPVRVVIDIPHCKFVPQ